MLSPGTSTEPLGRPRRPEEHFVALFLSRLSFCPGKNITPRKPTSPSLKNHTTYRHRGRNAPQTPARQCSSVWRGSSVWTPGGPASRTFAGTRSAKGLPPDRYVMPGRGGREREGGSCYSHNLVWAGRRPPCLPPSPNSHQRT